MMLSCSPPSPIPQKPRNTGFTGKTAVVVDQICGTHLCRVQIQDGSTVWADYGPFEEGSLICEYKGHIEIRWYKCPKIK